MSIVKYEIMKVVAETCNFTKAAEQLNLTQSAVSRSIKNLELELGSQIFIRKKSGVHLTRFGTSLLPQVNKILFDNEILLEMADAYLGNLNGHIIIGSFSSVSINILPDLIANFRNLYPNVHFEVKEGHYDEIKHWLHHGEIDFGFLIDEFIDVEEQITILSDEVKLLAPHGWIKGEFAPIKSLEEYPFIVTEHYPNPYLEGLFKKFQVKPNIQYIVKTNQTVFSFIEKGLGIALLPSSTLEDHLSFDIHDMDVKIPRNIRMVTMKEYMSQPIVKTFWKVVKDYMKKL